MFRILPFLVVTVLIVATTTAITAETKTKTAEEDSMEAFKSLKVGMVAPDFTLKGDDGADHSLRDYLGKKNIVLAFYPKNFTGG